ncbi:hypothetical protein LKL35_36035 [Streptomyces sp. ET3-23]|uniref:hypothetical protein n=1 Tax=Streptomyces sp. ET3-23 TaxID=2885643 RepID=UPI001D107F87|nr:hypothetical protein [Streptomyces sp. ET3-23]MCC2280748.1 hypothetical protein [Streptomyces sp. ET3-23]
MALAVRGALKRAAREQSTASWSLLRQRLGSALPTLRQSDRLEVLVRVEERTLPEEPLFSSLLAVSDMGSARMYRELASQLGRVVPPNSVKAMVWWREQADQLHRTWRDR